MTRTVRRSKYGVDTSATGKARRTVDGITFASLREARRYMSLRLGELAGEIKFLTLQPRHKLIVNGHLVATYVGDFWYLDVRTGEWVLEDAKGVRTEVYKIKAKLVKALHGIEIREV